MIVAFALVTLAAHAVLMLAAAPLLVGCLGWIEARLLGRAGASPLQPFRDLGRLVRKQPVVADHASWLFRAAPAASLATILAACMLVPSFVLGMASAPIGDLLVIAGLLAASRGIMLLAGMDVGTAFGGLGASRESLLAVFAGPAFFLVIFTLALLAGTTNLDGIVIVLRDGGVGLRVSLGMVLVAAVAVGLAENGRLPVGSAHTHLELAMGHQALALEYSGRHLALIEWAGALKLLVWLSLIAAVFVPYGLADIAAPPVYWLLGLAAWAVKIAVMTLALAVLETAIAKMRIFRAPEFLGVAVLLGLLAAVLLLVSQGFA